MQIALVWINLRLGGSFPPYEMLERHESDENLAHGYDGDAVRRVLRMFRSAEFKSKQAAAGLKVTSPALVRAGERRIARKR